LCLLLYLFLLMSRSLRLLFSLCHIPVFRFQGVLLKGGDIFAAFWRRPKKLHQKGRPLKRRGPAYAPKFPRIPYGMAVETSGRKGIRLWRMVLWTDCDKTALEGGHC
jgi:hypothetical protein